MSDPMLSPSGGVVVFCMIIVSDPVPFLFLWTLDLGLGFGTGLGLDNCQILIIGLKQTVLEFQRTDLL